MSFHNHDEEIIKRLNEQAAADKKKNKIEGNESGARGGTKWNRHRFQTKSVDDYRPIVFNPKYPWWCSGFNDKTATIVAYLPPNENLITYWNDAFNVETTQHETINFSDRFPRPDWFTE